MFFKVLSRSSRTSQDTYRQTTVRWESNTASWILSLMHAAHTARVCFQISFLTHIYFTICYSCHVFYQLWNNSSRRCTLSHVAFNLFLIARRYSPLALHLQSRFLFPRKYHNRYQKYLWMQLLTVIGHYLWKLFASLCEQEETKLAIELKKVAAAEFWMWYKAQSVPEQAYSRVRQVTASFIL